MRVAERAAIHSVSRAAPAAFGDTRRVCADIVANMIHHPAATLFAIQAGARTRTFRSRTVPGACLGS